MAGQWPLKPSILVRIQVPQPSFKIRFFAKILIQNSKKKDSDFVQETQQIN